MKLELERSWSWILRVAPVEDADGESDVTEDGPRVGAVVLDLGLLVVIALDQEGLHYVHCTCKL